MSLQPVSFRGGRAHLPRLSKPYVPGKRDPRFWSDEELDIIRRYYPAGGASACLAHLPAHRTSSGVYGQAKKLGLQAKAGDSPKVKIDRPPDFDDRLRQEWPQLDGKNRGAVAALADRLGVPRWWITKRATRLGLTLPHKKEPPWTKSEEALMSKVPLHDPEKCAAIFRENGFNRSPTAIVVRAKRIGLSRRFNVGLSARGAAKIIGIDDKGITACCISGELKATKRDDNRLPQQGGSRWVIMPADLRQFVIDNLGRIDFRKVDKFELVRLLTTEGGDGGTIRSGWAVAEDNIVKGGYARRLTIAGIIDELEASGFRRRSQASISGRAKLLGCLSSRAAEAWSKREDQILREAYAANVKIADIVGLLEDEGFKRSRGAIQMRAIVLQITIDRVPYWTEAEKKIALDGLRANKTHGEIREDLRRAGYTRGPTAMFKFAQKHRIVRKPDPWTEDHIALLGQRYAEKRPVKEIAAELGKPLASVRSRASQLGLKVRLPWTEAERQTLVDAHAAGDRLTAAAERIGRPYPNVAAEARRMGLSFLKRSVEPTPPSQHRE